MNSSNAESITDTFEYVLESLKTPKGGISRHLRYMLLPLAKAQRFITSLIKMVMNDIAEIMEQLQWNMTLNNVIYISFKFLLLLLKLYCKLDSDDFLKGINLLIDKRKNLYFI